jgi:hypothetical protein
MKQGTIQRSVVVPPKWYEFPHLLDGQAPTPCGTRIKEGGKPMVMNMNMMIDDD